MTKEEVNLYECKDMIQLQHLDTLVKKNTVKFHEYVNQHELLRIRFFLTDDVCKFLKTWIQTVYEDIISSKSQFSELGRIYELLLKNNFIKEFLDYSNSQEILQLKLVETVIENKRFKENLDAASKEVASLKSEYESLTQTYEEFSKNNFAKEFLNFLKPKETLRLKIAEKIDECQSLEICIDEACAKILTLNSELDKSIRRYQILSDNNNVQEFLSQAKYQNELRLKSTEKLKERIASLERQLKKARELLDIERRDRRKIDKESGCSKSSLDQFKKQTTSLELQLKKAGELLNTERCRRQKIEGELDSSALLSEELRRLLSKHLDGKVYEKTEKENTRDDHASPGISNIKVVVSNPSSCPGSTVLESKNEIKDINVNNIDFNIAQNHQISSTETNCIEPVVIKEEKTDDESLINPDARIDERIELSNSRINDNNSLPIEKTGVMKLSTESSLSGTSFMSNATSNCRELRKRTKDSCSSVELSKNKSPKIKPQFAKLHPNKRISKVSQKSPSDDFEDVSFCCDKCKKSFVVKPNERKPQKCPFCEMKSYQISNHRVNRSISALPVGTLKTMKQESEPSAVADNLAKAHKISS